MSCFYCSRQRRRLLFETAANWSCSKVALAHHADDLAETLLMNLFVHGEVSSMHPRQGFFEGRITIIRPLALVQERSIRRLARLTGHMGEVVSCPTGSSGQRSRMKTLINQLEVTCPTVRANPLRIALEHHPRPKAAI